MDDTYTVPECFSPEFAAMERQEYLHGAWGDPANDQYERAACERIPDSWDDERDEEPQPPQADVSLGIAEELRCPEGDETACPTTTCGCPPF